jgi:hypothetical protein
MNCSSYYNEFNIDDNDLSYLDNNFTPKRTYLEDEEVDEKEKSRYFDD